MATMEVGLDLWHHCISLLEQKQGWLVPQGALEGRPACGVVDHGVQRVLNPGEVLAPGGWMEGTHAAECRFQALVGPLCLAIGLGMVAG